MTGENVEQVGPSRSEILSEEPPPPGALTLTSCASSPSFSWLAQSYSPSSRASSTLKRPAQASHTASERCVASAAGAVRSNRHRPGRSGVADTRSVKLCIPLGSSFLPINADSTYAKARPSPLAIFSPAAGKTVPARRPLSLVASIQTQASFSLFNVDVILLFRFRFHNDN